MSRRGAEPEPEPEPTAEASPEPKRGFWARLFGRKKLAPAEPRPHCRADEPVAGARAGADEEPEAEREEQAFGTIEWEVPEPVAEEPEPEPEPDPVDPHASSTACSTPSAPRTTAPSAAPNTLAARAVRHRTLDPDRPRAGRQDRRLRGDEPEQRWMLRQPREVRLSFAEQVFGRPDATERQEIWMLRQPKAVRESFIEQVLAPRTRRRCSRSGCCARPTRSASRSCARCSRPRRIRAPHAPEEPRDLRGAARPARGAEGGRVHHASETAVEKQHAKGKYTARERIEKLLDPGSFQELDTFVRHRTNEFGMEKNRPWGDAVVTGHGTIEGRRVCVFSQDFTVFGGSLGEVMAEKMVKIMDLAAKIGCPVIGINDSGGARIQEGVVSLGAYGDVFVRNVQCSGVIPQISLIMGPCAGGAVYSPAMTDFIFMVKETSHMFITGPDVIKTVTGEEVEFEELGGAMSHNSKSGVAHFASDDEDQCIEDTRYLLSFLPQNNLETAPRVLPSDDPLRMDEELDRVVPDSPNKPYDMRDVVRYVVDDGEFFEVQEHFAQNIVCGYGRLNGYSVGIVGNQPKSMAGVLDIDASPPRPRASCAPATRSTSRSSRSSTSPASSPAPTRSGAGSSATARSCSTPSPRRPCRRSPSSRARPTAAPTTSWPPSTCSPTSTSPGRARRSR